MTEMKRYKYQALVTPYQGGDAQETLSSGSHRMVLRAQDPETHRTQVFRALVDSDEEAPFRPGKPEIMVTVRVIGDDVPDYFDIGSHFSLWLGSDVGQGIVTRRLHI
jgi:hypothetical protein